MDNKTIALSIWTFSAVGRMDTTMKKKLKRYFLNERTNALILFIIIFFNFICILKIFNSVESVIQDLSLILGFVGGIVGISLYELFKNNKNDIEDFYDNSKKMFEVDRKHYLDILQKTKEFTFLIGESGTGKSYILQQLKKVLENENKKITFINNNYYTEWDFEQFNDSEYIILDQFEKILDVSDFSKKIKMIKDCDINKTKIIISFRKEYFAEIFKKFDFNISINFIWLEYNEDEKKKIQQKLPKLIDTTSRIYKSDFTLFRQIVDNVKENKILFIQLSYICKIIQDEDLRKVQEDWNRYKDYNVLIQNYIETILDNYVYSDLAYLIIYLLCQDSKGTYINTLLDFQNISIESKERIKSTIEFLMHQKFVTTVSQDGSCISDNTIKYEISHDYLLEMFKVLTHKKVNVIIRNNIEFYNKNYQIERSDYIETLDATNRNDVNKTCVNFMDKKGKKFINALLYIMLFFIVIKNSYEIWFYPIMDNKSDRLFLLIVSNIVVGVSTYYIYSYYCYFLRILSKKYLVGVLFALLSGFIPYFTEKYWCLGFGIEIILMGSIMAIISFNVRLSEKDFFQTRCASYITIGIIICILCYYNPLYTQGSIALAWPFYFLYTGYMFLGILGHINRSYLLAMLGKVLYVEKEINDK